MVQVYTWAGLALTVALLAACGGGDDEAELVLPDANTLCSSIGVKPKIVNGVDCIPPESSPVVLVLALNSDGQTQSCSGTMLTPTRVLTAAHCMLAGTQSMAAVQWQADGKSALVYASGWVAHPGYTANGEGLQNDAGVITLEIGLVQPGHAAVGEFALQNGR